MDTADKLARLITELTARRRRPLTEEEHLAETAACVIDRFERRARELDGDGAPTGVDAIQLKYHGHADRVD